MGRLRKKTIACCLCAALAVGIGSVETYGKPDWPADTGIMAEAGIVMDADSGTVLFGQRIHTPLPPASITKLLTALIVAENCELGEQVTFSHDAVYNLEEGAGNKLSLAEGDVISVEDCLHMMLLLSSNQSANALAEHVAGSRDGFVEMMNEKLGELGCSDSHFANPTGLNDSRQYVSAYDMALIARAVFQNEVVLRISSTKRYSVGPTINNPEGAKISMEHKILMAENSSSQYYCEGALAGKTGYTSLAGNTLVTYASRGGRNLISVILKGSQPQYYLDAKTILNFGFSAFKNEALKDSETFLQEQEVVECGGTAYPASRLRLEEGRITLPLSAQFSDAERSLAQRLPDNHPQAAVGMLVYTYNERKIGSAYLYDTQLEAELASQERNPQEGTSAGEPQVEPETTARPQEKPSEGPESGRRFRLELPAVLVGRAKPWIAAALGGAALAGVVAALLIGKKRRERRERQVRRERRRQRLEEIGCSEEAFDELVRKRKDVGR